MIATLTIAVALLFLLVLLAWMLWPPAARSDNSGHNARIETYSRLIGDRICSEDDWQFIQLHAPELKSEFLRDRKDLLLNWLRNVRCATAESVRAYRTAVSVDAAVNPIVEIRIAASYTSFVVLCEVAHCIVWCSNPLAARSIIVRVRSIAEELSLGARQTVSKSPSMSQDTQV